MTKQPTLFPLPPRAFPTQGKRLRDFCRQYDIRTNRSRYMRRKDHPWLALIPFHADARKPVAQIMAESAGLYEANGSVATGEGELSAVRTLCRQLEINCPL